VAAQEVSATEDRLMAYFTEQEARRKRARRITAVIAVVVASIGGIAWGLHASGAKERTERERTEELSKALHCNLDNAIDRTAREC
jgi:hypothetical protein